MLVSKEKEEPIMSLTHLQTAGDPELAGRGSNGQQKRKTVSSRGDTGGTNKEGDMRAGDYIIRI